MLRIRSQFNFTFKGRLLFIEAFSILTQSFEKRLLPSSCPSVRPYVCKEELDFHWTDFREILYWGLLLKSVVKTRFVLQSEETSGTSHEGLSTLRIRHRSSPAEWRKVADTLWRKSKHEFQVRHALSENYAAYEIITKNTEEPDRPYTIKYVVQRTSICMLCVPYFPPPPAQQPLGSQGPLIIEASRSHSDTPHSLRLLWTSDQPEAGTST
jgi:hypothetical protein